MVNKAKFSTITAVITTIAAIAAMGSLGGGIGLGQQQTALAQVEQCHGQIYVPIPGPEGYKCLNFGEEEICSDIGADIPNCEAFCSDIGADIPNCEPDESQRVCPAPLIYVPVPGPQRYECIDLNLQSALTDIGQDFP